MKASLLGNLNLDPSKVLIQKGADRRTQILFVDLLYISFFADTSKLLEYLENMTEQVRKIDSEQNPRDL